MRCSLELFKGFEALLPPRFLSLHPPLSLPDSKQTVFPKSDGEPVFGYRKQSCSGNDSSSVGWIITDFKSCQ
jgi:hypothetical protein